MKITLNPPGKDVPGFNRRAYLAMTYRDAMLNGTMTAGMYKEMMTFLGEYIEVTFEPGEPPIPNEIALFEHATEAQMAELFNAMSGGGADAVPPVKQEPYDTP